MKLNRHKKLFILFVLLFIFYASLSGAFSIYREKQSDSIDLSILDSTGTVIVSFDANGGVIDPSDATRSVQSGSAVGSLPFTTRTNYNFIGWFTDPTDGVEISASTTVTGNTVTYYAHWKKIVCKKAVTGTLHTETCVSTGSCAASGGGYSANDTIYYGTIPGVNSPIVGDAYDCDVNDDDTWDPLTERFYFVRSYGNDEPNTSVLVHFTSFDELGQMDSSSSRNNYLYNDAISYLPTSSTWDNPGLNVINGNVTRFTSREDLAAACGSESGGNKFANCRFFLENTRYQSKELGRAGLWLLAEGNTRYRIHTEQLSVVTAESESKNAARPTIEVSSDRIEGYKKVIPETYSVTLNTQGGIPSEYSFERDENQVVGELPIPVKSGFDFIGWYTDNVNYTTEITENTVVTGDIVGYAKWEAKEELDYAFYIPGECNFTGSSIIDGQNGECISTINPTGSDIDYTISSLSAKKYIDTQIGLYNTDNHDRDFEVGFTIVDYSPSVNGARATFVHSKAEITGKFPGFTVRRNESTDNILIQSRKEEGKNAEVNFGYSTVQSVVIYRIDNAIYYSINGATKVKLNDITYNPFFNLTTWFGGAPVDESATSANRFLKGTLSNMYIKLASDLDVVFDSNYTGGVTSTLNVIKGKAVGELPVASRENYIFLGWFTEPTGGTQITPETIISNNITFYAHWAKGVTVTLHANGGSVSPNTITLYAGDAVGTLPEPTKTGYTFGGWYSDSELTVPVNSETIINDDSDFYAEWLEGITITFNADGGEVNLNSKTIISETAIGELPIPTKIGYDFDGWYLDSSYETEVTAATVFNSSTVIIAKWAELDDITVTFDADGGSVTPNSRTIRPGAVIGELPIPEKTDFNFVGWYLDNTYETEVTASTTFDSSTSIIAKWVDESYVACIENECYKTLAAAVGAVPTTNTKTVIKAICDISQSTTIEIASGKNIELDLQDFTVTNPSSKMFVNKGILYIKNGSLIGNGTETNKAFLITNEKNATLNISGGFINATGTNAIVNAGNVDITGGRIEANSQSAAINNNQYGVMTVSGGEIVGTFDTKGQAIYNDKGTLTVSGTAYLESVSQSGSANGRAALHNNAGTVTILGGTIISKNNAAVKNNATMTIGTDDGVIDINSPVMQGFNYGLETVSGKTVHIYDGVFKGKGTNKAISNESYTNTHNVNLVHTSEIIGSDTYDVAYLENDEISYTLTFNKNGGDNVSVDTLTYSDVGPIGDLPTATKANTEFLGWFTAATGGERVLSTTEVNDDATYYAHYTNASKVCRPATVLHTSGNTTFGQIPGSSSLTAGDAFDCDVNGDGTFDPTNERFYYLTDTSNGEAVLIFANNTSQVSNNATATCSSTAVSYASSFDEGPTTAMDELPTSAQWSNVNIYTEPRVITDNTGSTVTNNYLYTEKAARFDTLDEIKAATNANINGTANELASYPFLLENTISYNNGCNSNYWLETTYSNGGALRINGASNAKSLGHYDGSSGVRPVIEVPYSSIDGIIDIVEFDTIPGAMRTYFNNVNTWNAGQSDANYSSFNTVMNNNLNTYNCAYYTNDNTGSYSGSVFCDQPNKYDTGATGNINVYEYDESTGVVSNTIANYVFNDNGKLYNFIPGKTYYWESATDSSINGYVKPTGERRIITIPGTNRQTRNVRDLGGLPVDTDGDGTIDGKIKYQKLYRGEKIWGTNNSGATRAQFEKLGIYNEYDLRTPGSEIVTSEEDKLANYTNNEIVHYRIDHSEFGSAANEARFNGKSYYQLSRDAAIDVMKKVVAGNDDYALYFHCRIGADRTGTLAYLLEGVLGVPTEYRHQDYELTTFFGLRERTRYYFKKDSTNDEYKFIYLKKAIRHATPNNDEITGEENVMDWFLLEGNSTDDCSDITVLINQFRAKMIDYN